MKEELKQINEWLRNELDKIKIDRGINTFSNSSNKPYWNLEKKYKEKILKLKEKYNIKED